ncbi:MAG: phage virion morphogenesis protein [Rhodocyclaceae bacterium]|nr:phage virion morphogenesis protein [Rhodocyclaceae bacterium]
MSGDLAPFESRLAGLIASIEPGARRKLAGVIATRLRSSQGRRIGDQLNPDGTPYAPRKTRLRRKKGAIRRKMFTKLRLNRWLKVEATPESAVVTFSGQVQHMAQVHQGGLRDRVNRRGGPEVTYTARQLLGLTEAEIADIEDALLDHLAA